MSHQEKARPRPARRDQDGAGGGCFFLGAEQTQADSGPESNRGLLPTLAASPDPPDSHCWRDPRKPPKEGRPGWEHLEPPGSEPRQRACQEMAAQRPRAPPFQGPGQKARPLPLRQCPKAVLGRGRRKDTGGPLPLEVTGTGPTPEGHQRVLFSPSPRGPRGHPAKTESGPQGPPGHTGVPGHTGGPGPNPGSPTSLKRGLFPLWIRVRLVCPAAVTLTTGLMFTPGSWRPSITWTLI